MKIFAIGTSQEPEKGESGGELPLLSSSVIVTGVSCVLPWPIT